MQKDQRASARGGCNDHQPDAEANRSAHAAQQSPTRAEVAVAARDVVAVAAQGILVNLDALLTHARVSRIAEWVSAASALARINIVREELGGPLARRSRRATDIAAGILGTWGHALAAGKMLLIAEVVHAEVATAGGASSTGFEAAFRARWDDTQAGERHGVPHFHSGTTPRRSIPTRRRTINATNRAMATMTFWRVGSLQRQMAQALAMPDGLLKV